MRGRMPRSIVAPEVAPSSIPLTITGTGNSSYCYVIIGGTKRYGAGTYEVSVGDKITFGVYGYSNQYYGSVEMGYTTLLKVTNQTTQTYDWSVPGGIKAINISMTFTSTSTRRNGRISITTTT